MFNSRTHSKSKSVTAEPMAGASSNAHRASVPITVYRELAAELQATQVQLESLHEQNQRLLQQNQQLRAEIDNVLNSTQQLQQVVRSFEIDTLPSEPFPKMIIPGEKKKTAPLPPPEILSPPPPQPENRPFESPENLIAEVQEPFPRPSRSAESSSEISGWMLFGAIFLIIMTAFGTGFLVVRPLLNNNTNNN